MWVCSEDYIKPPSNAYLCSFRDFFIKDTNTLLSIDKFYSGAFTYHMHHSQLKETETKEINANSYFSQFRSFYESKLKFLDKIN